jgi:pyruvate kinase
MPPLTEKDLTDLEFGVVQRVDYVALSFVRRGGDMAALRQALRRLGADIPTIAKIETAEALGHLAAILKGSDGVMVARGDLGVELPPEKVPMLQKQIILEANESGIPCITATQMLQSMMHSPRPTRAEASDVANAILDGTDAVMLSGETAVGEYPLEAVETMARIALEVDSAERPLRPGQRPREGHAHSLARAARALASEVGARAVVVFTRGGFSAHLLSAERPGCPIYAFSDGERVYRRLALLHGVTPLLIQAPANTDLLLDQMPQELLMRGFLAPGDHVVMVRLSPSTARRHFNLVTVRTVGRRRRGG